jgi:NADH-quinone oxidoreductase subunit E
LPVTCLGACDRAPTMMVGDTLHADLTVDSINEVFK